MRRSRKADSALRKDAHRVLHFMLEVKDQSTDKRRKAAPDQYFDLAVKTALCTANTGLHQ